jgi:hypothetical protein
MNSSFDPFHLVNAYGAFGSVTRTRDEIILEGTRDAVISPRTKWIPYAFKGKPGDPRRRPPQVTPYHYKLDWQMWFAAMSPYPYHPWILNLVAKLLENDGPVLGLLGPNPFPDAPPTYIRAELYEYHFSENRDSGRWWDRKRVATYLPPLSLSDPNFTDVLKRRGWLE